ncbi:MAG: zincin-like metallopeptidase domain-containing protein, partial [Rhizomicrobium sp.]|nr:zincin-like metallopeptidase domain-containing protein [Rhizomicrobium sp.]
QGATGPTMLYSASLNRSDYAAWKRRSGHDLRANPDRRGITLDSALWVLCRYRHNTHWTRHETRLNREFGRKRWGDAGYATEELVAELGAAFLCADLGITAEPREDHASYVASWLEVLKSDKRAIFTAAAHAQRAADFLSGLICKNA